MKRILPSKGIRKGIDELQKEGATGDLPGKILKKNFKTAILP